MSELLRLVAAGTAIGTVAALVLPAMLPSAQAVEEPLQLLSSTVEEILLPPVDVADLVKRDVAIEPQIATEVLRSTRIKKIGFGRVEYVDIVETASGTYSTDAVESAHVRYPGIHSRGGTDAIALTAWSTDGWELLRPVAAGSFVLLAPFRNGAVLLTDQGSCAVVGDNIHC